ncbi:Orn/Lys/Arg family decarboxylase [Streptomyces olivaceoviridis]
MSGHARDFPAWWPRGRREGEGTGAAHRVVAAMVTVTPPGIPVLMPGESAGAPDGPLLRDH